MIPDCLRGSLIVSCQAPPGDPLDDVDTLRRIAASVVRGGAGGLRANGIDCILAFRQETGVPIIGIQKRRIFGEISITPDFASAKSIADAGADIIALDCTMSRSPAAEPWKEVLGKIQAEIGKPVLADIATLREALDAQDSGADAVATTLYGFTPETAQFRAVNWELIERLIHALRVPLIVEGHISQPEEVRRAIDLGAYAVVVGSAITRPESITARFAAALRV
ncbi:MAG: putative N-acetylmannosamine-6-phosphate 2-epimerase [Silvibacterium sp.]|nr:putative N-acetylmannosamine-6-phosphate 2-epimerase [Silvibacterium sp.]